jgi:predicted enzyme related to lactoylglutathione lyase
MARIRHLAILTEDVEKLVRFYTTAFGLKIVPGIGTATICPMVISTWRSSRSGQSGR